MKSRLGLVMAGGLLLACGNSQALGQIGNFTAPLGQPSYNNYAVPYGQMGQPTPSPYGAAYGQLGLSYQQGQLLPGLPSNFSPPNPAPSIYNQPIYAQSYFGIPNYAQLASGLPSIGGLSGTTYTSGYVAPAQVYTSTAPLGYVTNYAPAVQSPRPSTGAFVSARSPLFPH